MGRPDLPAPGRAHGRPRPPVRPAPAGDARGPRSGRAHDRGGLARRRGPGVPLAPPDRRGRAEAEPPPRPALQGRLMTVKWVKVDPLVMNGEPFCYGSRLTVRQLLELRRNGYALADLLKDHPELRTVGIAAAYTY